MINFPLLFSTCLGHTRLNNLWVIERLAVRLRTVSIDQFELNAGGIALNHLGEGELRYFPSQNALFMTAPLQSRLGNARSSKRVFEFCTENELPERGLDRQPNSSVLLDL